MCAYMSITHSLSKVLCLCLFCRDFYDSRLTVQGRCTFVSVHVILKNLPNSVLMFRDKKAKVFVANHCLSESIAKAPPGFLIDLSRILPKNVEGTSWVPFHVRMY